MAQHFGLTYEPPVVKPPTCETEGCDHVAVVIIDGVLTCGTCACDHEYALLAREA